MNVSIESSVITDVFNRKLFKEYGNYTGGGGDGLRNFCTVSPFSENIPTKSLKDVYFTRTTLNESTVTTR
jgi:hypothetical protein